MAEAKAHRARGKLSREALVAAAEDVFGEYGYNGASLAMISARVGITQAGLLHHFGSKEQLLLAVLDRHRELDEATYEALANLEGGDAVVTFADQFSRGLDDRRWLRLFAVLIGESILTDHPSRPYVLQRGERLRAALGEALRDGPDIDPDADVDAIVTILLAVSNGLRTQILLGESEDVHRAFAVLIDLIRSYLRPHATV